MADNPVIEDNQYDLSSIDFSEFDEPPPTGADADTGYDLSSIDWSEFDGPATPEEDEESGDIVNAVKGMGARATELGGQLVTFAADRAVDYADQSLLKRTYEFATDDKIDLKDNPIYDTAMRGADYLKDIDLGHEPRYTWERLKNDPGLLNTVGYVGETGLASLPDMVMAVNRYTLPIYVATRSQEMGETRAENKGKSKADLIDVLEASPFAAGSALLERLGGKAVLDTLPVDTLWDLVKEVGKATIKEGGTEAIQEGAIEYTGERLGTDVQMDINEAADRALGAAVAGGGFGGGVRGVTASVDLAINKPEASDVEVAQVINDAPDLDTAIKIAEDVAEGGEIDTTPIVQDRAFDEGGDLVEAAPVENLLKDTAAPRGTGFFKSKEEALASKQNRMANYDPQRRAEMANFEAIERVPGQWILERQEVDLTPTGKDATVDARNEEDRRTEERPVEDRRKRVADMTREEMQGELYQSHLIPELGNKRGYEETVEDQGEGVFHVSGDEYFIVKGDQQAAIDADSLKWINDNIDHSAGDEFLRVTGRTIKESWIANGKDMDAGLKDAREKLKRVQLKFTKEDGTIVELSGIHFSYGIGTDQASAEEGMHNEKSERAKSGERFDARLEPEGAIPKGVKITKPERSDKAGVDREGGQVDVDKSGRESVVPGEVNERREASTETRRVQPETRTTEGQSRDDTGAPRVGEKTDSSRKDGNGEKAKAKKQKAEVKPKPKKTLRTKHVKVLEDALGLKEGGVVQVSSTKSGVSKAFISLVEDTLGKKVIFFKATGPKQPNGFMMPDDANTIYINVDSKSPHMAVMGHELLHTMRADNPKVYADLKAALEPQLQNYKPYKDALTKARKYRDLATPSDLVVEELIADMVGENFTDVKFWEAMRENTTDAKFKAIIKMVKEWVQDFNAKVKNDMPGTEFFEDYEAAQSAVVKALNAYQKDKITEAKAKKTKAEKAPTKQDSLFSEKLDTDKKKDNIPKDVISVKEATGKDAMIEEFQRKVVDMFQPIRKVQKAIEATGEKLSDALNIDQALTRFPGSTRAALDDFMNIEGKPFIELFHKSGLSWKEAAKYLHARHAKESNAILKSRNPDMENNEALSGMSDKDADTILKKYADRPEVKAIGTMNDRMNKNHVKFLQSEGLLSAEEAEAWSENYNHYVPLHRDIAGVDGVPTIGQGFDIRGKSSKLRAGSNLEVDYDNMLARIISQREASIIRSGKNKVAKTFHDLAATHPDDTLWETDVNKFPKDIATLLKSGEISRSVDLQSMNVVSHKVAGKDKYMYLNKANPIANQMAEALRKSNQAVGGKFVQAAAMLNRYLSQIVTSLSPEFVISNFARDIQTAAYNLTDTELKDFTGKVLKGVPGAMADIRNALRGEADTEGAALFDQFRRDGGMTGWMDATENLEDRMKQIQRDVEGWKVGGIKGKESVENVFEWISDYNTVVENGVRFSAYKRGLEAGLSRAKSAKIAKELTVDFNRKGEMGTLINSFYMFFNASIQGSARLLRAADPRNDNTKLRKMMVATVMFSAMNDFINRLTSDDDEYNKLISEQGSRSFVVMDHFGFTDDGFIKIPLPWGYNVLHVAGQELSSTMAYAAGMNPAWRESSGTTRMLMSVTNAFNPVQEGSILQTLSPTFADPIVRIQENKDWHGGPLYPDFNPQAPNYTKFYGTARPESKEVAKWLYEATVDPDTMQSWADVSPEWIDMGYDFLTGGIGRFAADTYEMGKNLITGDDFEMKQVPLARKVLGTVGPSAKKSNFYDKMYSIVNMDTELGRIKDQQGVEDFKKARKAADPKRLRLVNAAKAARTDVNRRKKQIAKLKKLGRNEQARKVEKLMLQRMDNFNKLYQKRMYGKENFTD